MMKTFRQTIVSLALGVSFSLAPAAFAVESNYADGKQALRERDWEAAALAFSKSTQSEPELTDAATYWRAYALFKSGNAREGRLTLQNFSKRFPDSRWLDDVRVLLAEQEDEPNSDSIHLEDNALDSETRLYLLARLMEQQPDRALPLLREMLQDKRYLGDENVRRNMLFIVAVSDDPEAQALIGDLARGSQDTNLQMDAIHVLGASGSRRSVDLIGEIYRSSDSFEVKQAALQASIAADEPALALDVLRSTRDTQLQLQAIQTLGVLDETEPLYELYDQFESRGVREAVLQALMIADDARGLQDLVEREPDPELRRAAIRNLALTGELESAKALEDLYSTARSSEEKHAVIESLHLIGEEAESLALRIALEEQEASLKKRAIQALGIMDSPRALLRLYPTLEERSTKQSVVQALMVAGAGSEMIGLLEQESDQELRATLIQHIAIAGEDGAAEYLVEAYAAASRGEKENIINSMIVMDQAEPLIEMLKQEQDRVLKQKILQTLVMLDSDEATEYLLEALEEQR